jgi:hypothetical protein
MLKKFYSFKPIRAFWMSTGNANSETIKKTKVVLFPGNGIGPEISHSIIDIFKACNVPI